MNDDELLARLRAADPALTSRAPLPDINRLVEAALNTDITPVSDKTPVGITTRPAKTFAGRGRLLALAAAAGLLMVGGIVGGIMANGDSGHSSASGPLTLTTSGTAHAKCTEPIPDQLRKYPTLFEGTVTSVSGSSVSFRVDQWLQGGDSDTVKLKSNPKNPETLSFLAKEHYIVAATKNGTVPQCGANMASDETRNKFRQAFGK